MYVELEGSIIKYFIVKYKSTSLYNIKNNSGHFISNTVFDYHTIETIIDNNKLFHLVYTLEWRVTYVKNNLIKYFWVDLSKENYLQGMYFLV